MPESIHTKDESKRGSAFAFIFGGIDQYNECNGMTSFMEFMLDIFQSPATPPLQMAGIATSVPSECCDDTTHCLHNINIS